MKRILITGASRGIGRAIAEKLAAPDVTLLLHGRDTVALAETCKSVQSQCAGVIKLIHDLATEEGVSNLISQVGGDPLDVLINNAGIAVVKPFREITRDEWEQTLGVNVTAPFLLMQRFAGQMPPGSSVVNVLSIAAKTVFAISPRRIARTPHPDDQHLSGGDEYRDLGRRGGRLAAREDDFTGASRLC